jgi:hypothetical protein
MRTLLRCCAIRLLQSKDMITGDKGKKLAEPFRRGKVKKELQVHRVYDLEMHRLFFEYFTTGTVALVSAGTDTKLGAKGL